MSAVDRRVKVVHIITRLDRGGSSEVVLDLAERMDRTRFAAQIVTGRTDDPVCDLTAYTRRTGVPVAFYSRLRRDIMPLDDLIACIQLTRHLRRARPDIVHTHSSKAGVLGRIAAWLAGVPIVVHAPHGHVFYGYFGRLGSAACVWIERLMAYGTDRIVTLTEMGKQDHIRYGVGPPDRFVPIPCGIEVSRFSQACRDGQALRQTLNIEPDVPVILWVGRLVSVKGCEVFLKACETVARQHAAVRFCIVGDGPLAAPLKRMASELGLEDRVRFMGWRSDIPAWMALADMFVLSSLNEGLGRVLLEAMAARTPVVATRVGAVGEIVRDGETGILVPPNDPEQLADGMRRLLQDTALARRMGEQGYHRALTFDTQRMIEKTADLYESLLEAGRPGSDRYKWRPGTA